MKLIENHKNFPPLNVCNVQIPSYEIKGVIRHYHYRAYPKLFQGIVAVIIITFGCHACETQLTITWDQKINMHVIRKYTKDF